MTSPYQYTPLPTPKSIRLIRLRNTADKDSPLECEFQETSLDDPAEYTALSYTWGGESANVPLAVMNSSGGGAPPLPPPAPHQPLLMVTPNCAAVLKILRDPRIRLSLWVDAVCINQSSDEEKSVQVSMMAELYQKAKYVFVWLGNEWAPASTRALYGGLPRVGDDQEQALDPQVLSVIQRAPYWLRVWTLQEAAYVNSFLLCRDGGGVGLAKALRKWGDAHRSHPDPNQLAINMRRKIMSSLPPEAEEEDETERRGKINVYQLRMLLYLKSTEPRDKIYALRAVFPDTFGKVGVNYRHPVEEVYLEATKRHILGQAALSHLLLLGGGGRESGISTTPSPSPLLSALPSWALDWSTEVPDGRILLDVPAAASRGSRPYYRFSDDSRTLFLRGRTVARLGDRISPKLPIINLSFVLADKKAEFTAWVHEAMRISRAFMSDVLLPPPPAGASDNDRASGFVTFRSVQALLVRILEANERTKEEAVSLSVIETVEALAAAVSSSQSSAMLMISNVNAALGSGCMFLTSHGRFGFCVAEPVPGDEICIFSGLDFPLVVRPQGTGYVIVGYGIVDGVMDGELWPNDESELTEWPLV
ncbi:HET domain-containing protein [Colletotrichum orchidophilum]|uniref:HET domain-containing protein n=1 Tax=Colletotrichum orchidophilum TaxID=1209926 RepID=A0A1G4ASG1_9PEZI|nr:HET domain-containing protein [Colletotrichum orchidophilum]OHE92107.1 HET domain-containing protein [Colletotrichum orchidophilum]